MAVPTNLAAQVLCPFGDGGANTNVVSYTASTTPAADQLPDDFCGKFVTLIVIGDDVYLFLSRNSSAAVDGSVAPTSSGTQDPKQGYPVRNGQAVDWLVPELRSPSEHVYLCRVTSTTNANIYIRQSSP